MAGIKYSTGKLRYDLIPSEPLKEVALVFTRSVEKYKPGNWQEFTPKQAKQEFGAALFRHFEAWRLGETKDAESGAHPLAHVVANAMFLIWFDIYYPDKEVELLPCSPEHSA